MKQDDMREAMLALEKAKGRYRMYTIAALCDVCIRAGTGSGLYPDPECILDDRCLCGCGARFLDSRHYQPCPPGAL